MRTKFLSDITLWLEGDWPKRVRSIEAPLMKNVLKSGERMVKVSQDGKPCRTDYRIIKLGRGYTLIEAQPITGRTHQIRVHCQFAGHPIVGDVKYWEWTGSNLSLMVAESG